MRKLVVRRVVAIGIPKDKRGPSYEEEQDEAEPKGAESEAEAKEEADEGEPMDEVKCPNCGIHIDTVTGKEIKGKEESDSEEESPKNEGKELDTSDEQYPTPGPFGAANDAARGATAEAKILGALKGMRA